MMNCLLVFKIKNLNSPELINIKNKYYTCEITSQNKISRGIAKTTYCRQAIVLQIKFKKKFENQC